MSDRSTDSTWGETARRIASEFDERLGSPAAEIVTFESSQRAIAVGIVLAETCARSPMAKLLATTAKQRRWRGGRGRMRARQARRKAAALREVARVHRVIVLGILRCVNCVYLLQGPGQKLYAVHGVGAEGMQDELRADMDAIAARLAAVE